LLGSARAIVALGFFKEMAGVDTPFYLLTYYMAPVGWLMVILLWIFFVIFLKPERAAIPGLRERVKELSEELGPISKKEILSLIIIFGAIIFMSLQVTIPALQKLDKTAIILVATVLFFVTNILDIEDLELIPWNIVLLFSGAMSIGYCLWKTGAAEWMAVNWLVMFQQAHWLVFVLSVAFFVMVLTNFIMNVAAIAISLPVALVIAKYLGVAPHVVMYAALMTAGMPFILLVGAAPNAIAYDSKQFTSGEFFKYGCIASIILMVVCALACYVVWPLLGMPTTVPKT
jgi:sodium-dependent dicarboxylate transporter 2/3/5